jgi:hypothetical protein
MIKTLLVSVAVILGLGTAASAATPNSDAPETAGLFEHSCLVFIGQPDQLRAWIAQHDLPEVTGDQKLSLLNGSAGIAFWANNKAGNRGLVSYDDGGCKVVAEASNFDLADKRLLDDLRGATVTVTMVTERTKPDGSAHQKLYRAFIGQKKWIYSITAHAIPGHPDMPPQLDLIATVDTGQRVE